MIGGHVMKPGLCRYVFGILVSLLLVESTGCAQPPPVRAGHTPNTSSISRSATIANWLAQGSSKIGVVALAPDQFLYHDWFEFDSAFKAHFAQKPMYTTVPPKKLKRREIPLGEAFHDTFQSYFESMPNSGQAAGMGLALAPAVIAFGTLTKAAIGELAWVQPPPIVQPLDGALSPENSVPTGLLSKKRLALEIGMHITESAHNQTTWQFLEVPFEQARQRSQWTSRADGLLTVRVQWVDLIADEGDNPHAMLFVHVWTNFNRLVSRPIEYTSRRLELSTWAKNDWRLLRDEVDRAVESITDEITSDFLPAPELRGRSNGDSPKAAMGHSRTYRDPTENVCYRAVSGHRMSAF